MAGAAAVSDGNDPLGSQNRYRRNRVLIAVTVVTYLRLIELCKALFFGREATSRS